MLVDCTVITDRETKASKGYAFVKYRTAEEALKALNADISINNTKLIVSFACQNANVRNQWMMNRRQNCTGWTFNSGKEACRSEVVYSKCTI